MILLLAACSIEVWLIALAPVLAILVHDISRPLGQAMAARYRERWARDSNSSIGDSHS